MAKRKKKRRYLGVLFFLVVIGLAAIYISSYKPILPGYHSVYYTPEKYQELKSELEGKKKLLAENLREARRKNSEKVCMDDCKRTFRKTLLDKVFPFWYGTRWSFYGTTEVPGESSIACGYFVTTILRDLGCKINRARLAQVPSEEMIKALVKEKYIKKFSNVPFVEFVKDVKKEGSGVFVIGLDNHTGFIVNHEGESYFIHSSGAVPFCVVQEKTEEASVLRRSKYRVVGLLTKDDSFIKKWLMS